MSPRGDGCGLRWHGFVRADCVLRAEYGAHHPSSATLSSVLLAIRRGFFVIHRDGRRGDVDHLPWKHRCKTLDQKMRLALGFVSPTLAAVWTGSARHLEKSRHTDVVPVVWVWSALCFIIVYWVCDGEGETGWHFFAKGGGENTLRTSELSILISSLWCLLSGSAISIATSGRSFGVIGRFNFAISCGARGIDSNTNSPATVIVKLDAHGAGLCRRSRGPAFH